MVEVELSIGVVVTVVSPVEVVTVVSLVVTAVLLEPESLQAANDMTASDIHKSFFIFPFFC